MVLCIIYLPSYLRFGHKKNTGPIRWKPKSRPVHVHLSLQLSPLRKTSPTKLHNSIFEAQQYLLCLLSSFILVRQIAKKKKREKKKNSNFNNGSVRGMCTRRYKSFQLKRSDFTSAARSFPQWGRTEKQGIVDHVYGKAA